MTSLGKWLAGILNAHIERHNVVTDGELVDRPLARYYTGVLDLDEPCWACGDPVGFRTFHLPCWKVPPFKRTAANGQYP